MTAVLELDQARISYFTRSGEVNVIPGISLKVGRGEALGLVGETGCGKSTVAFAVMRYLSGSGRLTGGRILFEGQDIGSMTAAALRGIRGSRMAMVYQDPMSSLNPLMRIGRQLMEVPLIHKQASEEEARHLALKMLAEVSLPDPGTIFERYPHQLSGGQQQRVVIAMALMAEPALLVMDEPTTGLDVTVEAAVLELVQEMRRRHNSAIVFISHNLGTVMRVCDRIGVMYAGELVEEGPVREVLQFPRHPYTRGLLNCIPLLGSNKASSVLLPISGQMPSLGNRPQGCIFASRCDYVEPGRCTAKVIPLLPAAGGDDHRVQCIRLEELPAYKRPETTPHESGPAASGKEIVQVSKLQKTYSQSAGFSRHKGIEIKVLRDVDLSAAQGMTLAIVGESGCGKSTFAKILTGMEIATGGQVMFDGTEIGAMPVERRAMPIKKSLQMIFQNPESTLNPSHSVGYIIARALRRLRGLSSGKLRQESARLLERVKLPAEIANRMPRQLSGGQKQRVAIARALAGSPRLVIADEPVSALDVSVQAAIVNLLLELQQSSGLTLIFISHDLSVVRYLADRVAVMYLGKIVELGSTEDIFDPPYHPYTEALLSAMPSPDPNLVQRRIILKGGVPSAEDVPLGCSFANRCPRKIGKICETVAPPEHEPTPGHKIACHISLDELRRIKPVISIAQR